MNNFILVDKEKFEAALYKYFTENISLLDFALAAANAADSEENVTKTVIQKIIEEILNVTKSCDESEDYDINSNLPVYAKKV